MALHGAARQGKEKEIVHMLEGAPPCQEDLGYTIYCSSCGDVACCRAHAAEGCGYNEPFMWTFPVEVDPGTMCRVYPTDSGEGVMIQRKGTP